ncbi:hypothetical protein [Flavobacterium rhizosphaerae]|uniref:Uncharacterized protein n=1 Tax=Flavobacterium rhizosphaerae TaxID=3163298 RepID=A0ABW8Z1V3_9FLAO
MLLIAKGLYGMFNGYVFYYDLLRIEPLLGYPYNMFLSLLLFIFITITFIQLWLEKKKAAYLGIICFCVMIGLCLLLLLKGALTGRFYLRIEMIIFIDAALRLSDKRKDWEKNAVARAAA